MVYNLKGADAQKNYQNARRKQEKYKENIQ